ncbi:MAG: UDP-N-acetylmuramate dehydrogenase [Lachnospiraceae bacterium]|nr:UDP-N-acetylmuramate dehydrogenase [Lachnospiraceae bacterium]
MGEITYPKEFSAGLKEIMKDGRLLKDEPMAKHITFRTGGPADWYAYIENVEMLQQVIGLCKQFDVPYYVIGNGSNVLVSDAGIRGVVLRLSGEFDEITLNESVPEGICRITAGAGAMLSRLAMAAGKKGFTGLEFAGGIPGTIGGAVLMNAGAYGGEIKDTLWAVEVLTKEGTIQRLTTEELKLSYRHSILMETGGIVLKAYFTLKIRPKIQIFATMESYRKARQEKQPLEFPSAGSTFKRPVGYFAGKLIQDAGLMGYKIGGAMVSTKHAGFVINAGDATAEDVCEVIAHVTKTVREQFGVTLEPEVRFLGEF